MFNRPVSLVVLLIAGLLMGLASYAYAEFVQSPGVSVILHATPEDYQKTTGDKITQFGEAPALAALVEKGELLPVKERLPKDFMVYTVAEIGQYGGDLRRDRKSVV